VNQDGLRLFHGDCIEAMRKMPDKCYELAITDPPYGVDITTQPLGKGARERKSIPIVRGDTDWDSLIPSSEYFEQLMRVSVNQIIWGGNYFIDHLHNTRCVLIWDKLSPNNDFAAFEMAWTSFDRNAKSFQRARGADDPKDKIHVTQKPVKLYEWLLKNYAEKGDRILDTHLGSGSVAIACYNLGFELTGYEIDKTYYDALCKRVSNHINHDKTGFQLGR